MELEKIECLHDLSHNVALCLFGHARTFNKNAPRHLKLASALNCNIYGHTWAVQDVADSWHSINSGSHTAVREDTLSAVYKGAGIFSIEEQNEELNRVRYIDSSGRVGIVGHQFHMWQSILTAGEMALRNGNADYLLFTRYDINISVPDVLKLPVKIDAWNSIARHVPDQSEPVIECYDLFFVVNREVFLKLLKFRDFDTFKGLISDYYLLDELANMGVSTNFDYGLFDSIKIRRPVSGYFNKIFRKIFSND